MAEIIVGNVGTIVSVALKIKEAVETVQQNKKECCAIAKCEDRVSALLKWLEDGTKIPMNTAMCDVLEDLAESLEEALGLVTECQQRHIISRFFGAGDMAKELRRVQEDIMQKIMQASLAINIHVTIIMTTHVQHAGAPPTLLTPDQVVTDGKEGRLQDVGDPPLRLTPEQVVTNGKEGCRLQDAGAHPLPWPQEQVVTDIECFTEFSLSELKAATDDFSDENIIGRGAFAIVYKGVLRNGQVVAIKKFSDIHKYFKVDKWRNYFLVLGYVPNGSLHNITEGTQRIDWSSCFRIIEGIAEGVCYLHEKRLHEKCVVHMDLKPQNIVLDSDMNPVIIDFGLSVWLDHDDEIYFDDIIGTPRYMAPEFIGEGKVSTKCDVFAFGITLVQTINSLCATSKTSNGREPEEWVRMVQEAGGVKGLLDPTLQVDETQVMEIERCIKVALLCIQMDPTDRPTMADVVEMLNGEKEIDGLMAMIPFYNCEAAPASSSSSGVSIPVVSLADFMPKKLIKRRKQRTCFDKNGGEIVKRMGIKTFTEVELAKMTKSYSNRIGKGNFGEVFKGTTDDNQQVAVKRPILEGTTNKPREGGEFIDEIIFQFRIRHDNLVRLIGCCLETEFPRLVFEFIPNGSLYEVLHGTGKPRTLSLLERLDIAIGSAEALAYMHSRDGHQHSRIHGDVKSGNILLDDDLMPKVSDFGSSKLMSIGSYARSVLADRNYMDPMYFKTDRFTEKSDVYSFGVVLLELITRKKVMYDGNNSLPLNFVKSCKSKGNGRTMYDLEILSDDDAQYQVYMECLDRIGALAVRCLKEDVDERPTMTEVVEELKQAKLIVFGGTYT
ncbi:uncharacterized protein LOC133886088 isoform X2 [Phragmites australis]|uniref:uncharacterized protein LOC133886088 isoform X2 n=1 Tax=Phragmites australis TaxID=29695 RepID=UPI002D78E058|nr:uncharacterized protein LOC133886088 isoform X2 [Phragmites australis]